MNDFVIKVNIAFLSLRLLTMNVAQIVQNAERHDGVALQKLGVLSASEIAQRHQAYARSETST